MPMTDMPMCAEQYAPGCGRWAARHPLELTQELAVSMSVKNIDPLL